MVAVVTMQVKYWGIRMRSEAYRFFSTTLLLTLIIGIHS